MKKYSSFLFVLSVFFLSFPIVAQAQNLNERLESIPTIDDALAQITWSEAQLWGLLLLRFILIGIITFSSSFAAFRAYGWWMSETNAEKVYQNKEALGRLLLILTIALAVLSIYNIFVPDFNIFNSNNFNL